MKYRVSAILDASLMGPVVELLAPYGQVSVKLVDEEGAVKRPIPATVETRAITRRRHSSQNIFFMPEKGLGTVVVLRAVAKNLTVPQIKRELEKHGLARNGSGATLSKLKHRGYVKHLEKGMWALSLKGETALRKLEGVRTEAHEVVEAEHESSDSEERQQIR